VGVPAIDSSTCRVLDPLATRVVLGRLRTSFLVSALALKAHLRLGCLAGVQESAVSSSAVGAEVAGLVDLVLLLLRLSVRLRVGLLASLHLLLVSLDLVSQVATMSLPVCLLKHMRESASVTFRAVACVSELEAHWGTAAMSTTSTASSTAATSWATEATLTSETTVTPSVPTVATASEAASTSSIASSLEGLLSLCKSLVFHLG